MAQKFDTFNINWRGQTVQIDAYEFASEIQYKATFADGAELQLFIDHTKEYRHWIGVPLGIPEVVAEIIDLIEKRDL